MLNLMKMKITSVLSYEFIFSKHIQTDKSENYTFKTYLKRDFFLSFCMFNQFSKFLMGHPVYSGLYSRVNARQRKVALQ